jgi:hypothetical protein
LPGPEKTVEQIAEKGREHIDLGESNRNLVRPIIDDNSIRLCGLFRTRIIPVPCANAIAISVIYRGNSRACGTGARHVAMMAAYPRGANRLIARYTSMRAIGE